MSHLCHDLAQIKSGATSNNIPDSACSSLTLISYPIVRPIIVLDTNLFLDGLFSLRNNQYSTNSYDWQIKRANCWTKGRAFVLMKKRFR